MLKEKISNNEELNKKKRNAQYELAFKKNSCKELIGHNSENKEFEESDLIEIKKDNFIVKMIKRIIKFFKKNK